MTTVSEVARGLLEGATPGREDLEGLDLAAFQARAVDRLVATIESWGGALLADDVGLGKTRVALTVARIWSTRLRRVGVRGPVVCVVPSRTLRQWRDAAEAAGFARDAVRFVTHSALSRGDDSTTTAPAFLVVDEAHRFRNRRTKRRARLERALGAPLLLLTATPVVNATDDLRSLLELFVEDADVARVTGYDLETTFALAASGGRTLEELLREVVVRRIRPSDGGFGDRPGIRLELLTYEASDAEEWLWTNLEGELGRMENTAFLEDWPRGLFIEYVLRLWESGPDAFSAGLGELIAYHRRWLEAVGAGGRLTRADFRDSFAHAADQQVFGFLFESGPTSSRDEVEAVRRDLDILLGLDRRLEPLLQANSGREAAVADLAADGEKLLVFTSYRNAAIGLYERLVAALGPRAKVGVVTGSEARATGLGRTTGTEVVRRFAPRSQGASYRPHESLDVLVATDCLSEGMNLQDCGRVVLVDLPYTPVAVQQRIGRLVRPGSRHDVVTVYLPRPSVWNDSLGMRRRLDEKLHATDDAAVPMDSVLRRTPQAADPLRPLDDLDHLAHAFAVPGQHVRGCWRAGSSPLPGLAAIGLAEVVQDGRRRPWLFGVGSAGGVVSLEVVVEALAELVHDTTEVEGVEPPAWMTAVIARKIGHLEAARLSPPALSLDDVEVAAWVALEDVPERETLRDRLLRPQSIAARRSLEALLETNAPQRLRRYVEGLEPRGSSPVEVALVTAVIFD